MGKILQSHHLQFFCHLIVKAAFKRDATRYHPAFHVCLVLPLPSFWSHIRSRYPRFLLHILFFKEFLGRRLPLWPRCVHFTTCLAVLSSLLNNAVQSLLKAVCLAEVFTVDSELPLVLRFNLSICCTVAFSLIILHWAVGLTISILCHLFCADLQLKAEILSHIGSIADGPDNVRGSSDR